jgi:hypothetical protein
MSKVKQKLKNHIETSKIEINKENMQETNLLMKKQLSYGNIRTIINIPNITVHHMESLYRDNTYDKYEYMIAGTIE